MRKFNEFEKVYEIRQKYFMEEGEQMVVKELWHEGACCFRENSRALSKTGTLTKIIRDIDILAAFSDEKPKRAYHVVAYNDDIGCFLYLILKIRRFFKLLKIKSEFSIYFLKKLFLSKKATMK